MGAYKVLGLQLPQGYGRTDGQTDGQLIQVDKSDNEYTPTVQFDSASEVLWDVPGH